MLNSSQSTLTWIYSPKEAMMNYQLGSGVYFVEGALNGALIDTTTGNVYSVNSEACQILSYQVLDEAYWTKLMELGLAIRTKTRERHSLPRREIPTRPRFLWLELLNRCNLQCLHCYASSDRTSCLSNAVMKHRDWKKALQEAYALGCRACQLTGGEVLLYRGANKQDALDLAEYARKLGYRKVEIYTNGTLLTRPMVERIARKGISVAVTLYSSLANVHEAITQKPGSFKRTIQALCMLKEVDASVRVEVPLLKQNQHTVEETLALRASMGLKGRSPDPIRPSGRGSNPQLFPDVEYLAKYGLNLEPNFTANKERLAIGTSLHPCLWGKLAILESGDVIPCVFSRRQDLGNLLKGLSIEAICNNPTTQTHWGNSKDNILVCKDCEYRYICGDCRPLAYGATRGRMDYKVAPYPRCTYNPYQGVWQEGLWQIDEKGQPFYNTSLKI